MRKQSVCAQALDNNIEEVLRVRKLEKLRVYLIREKCFSAYVKDPLKANITMDELKKLARIWRLNDRRNFWKDNIDRDCMVVTLMKHVEESEILKSEMKSQLLLTSDMALAPNAPNGSKAKSSPRLVKNYCGGAKFTRDISSSELARQSRYVDGLPGSENTVEKMLRHWRNEDQHMTMIDDEQKLKDEKDKHITRGTFAHLEGHNDFVRETQSLKLRLSKHLNLSVHLVNFSVSIDITKRPITRTNVQAYLNVSDSNDWRIASNSVIGLSNICSYPLVRSYFIELSGINKLVSLIPLTKGHAANLATALIYYYFSCESELEDRIYTAASTVIVANCITESMKILMITLYTLSNLLPSIDRIRITRQIMKIIAEHYEPMNSNKFKSSCGPYGEVIPEVIVHILTNVVAFTNVHLTLFEKDILELLPQLLNHTVNNNDDDMKFSLVKIFHALLHSNEATMQIYALDYGTVLVNFLKIPNENVFRYSMRSLAFLAGLSSAEEITSCSETVSAVTSKILAINTKVSVDIAIDVSQYLSNICKPISVEYIEGLIEDGVPDTILKLLNYFKDLKGATFTQKSTIQKYVIRALQNILSIPCKKEETYVELTLKTYDILSDLAKKNHDIGVLSCLYNISCVASCKEAMYKRKIHLQVIENFCSKSASFAAKTLYLQILVQLALDIDHNNVVKDLFEVNIIASLESSLDVNTGKGSQVHTQELSKYWDSMSKLLLAVTSYCSSHVKLYKMENKQILGVIKIITMICTEKADEKVIIQCSLVLAYLSLIEIDFDSIDHLLRKMMGLKSMDNSLVMETLSTVLYNLSCDISNAFKMVDSFYLNNMIATMRKGNIYVQINIAAVIRTLCSSPLCVELMLKNELLSDLVVIALLRSSSLEIKIICSEIFYNMLCHSNTRKKLLTGDFWWGMMRLCRTDSNEVRQTCARTLFDLSSDIENLPALRINHVLSFIQENTSAGAVEFLEDCMYSVMNMIGQVDNTKPFEVHEINCTVLICVDAFNRSSAPHVISNAIALLAQMLRVSPAECAEIKGISNDLLDGLLKCRDCWEEDSECCQYLCEIVWGLSSSSDFTNRVEILKLSSILEIAYLQDPSPQNSEKIAAVLSIYASRENIDPEIIADIRVFNFLMNDVFISSKESLDNYFQNETNSKSSLTVHVPWGTLSCLLYVYCYILNDPKETFKIHLTPELVTVLLSPSFIKNKHTKNFILFIINSFSQKQDLALFMIKTNFASTLLIYQHGSRLLSESEILKSTEFCSIILRNITIHAHVLTKITSNIVSTGVDELIRMVLEDASTEDVIFNILVCVYNFANNNLKHSNNINPHFILESIKSMEEMLTDRSSTRISKYIVGMVLEKYAAGMDIDPDFVATNYNDIKLATSMIQVPSVMADVKVQINKLDIHFPEEISSTIVSFPVELLTYSEEDKMWQAIIISEKKQMSSLLMKMTSPMPISSTASEIVELFPLPQYEKLIYSYDRVMMESDTASFGTSLLEEGDEDEEEEDDKTHNNNNNNNKEEEEEELEEEISNNVNDLEIDDLNNNQALDLDNENM